MNGLDSHLSSRNRQIISGAVRISLTVLFPLLSLFMFLLLAAPPALGEVEAAAEIDAYDPDTAAITADLAYVTVANHNYVAVVDLAAGTVTETIDLSPSGCSFPWRLAIPPDGETVWVSCRYSWQVMVIDRSSHAILETISVQSSPADIAFTQDSAHALIGTRDGNDIAVLDTTTFALAATITTDDYGPAVVVMHPFRPLAYAAHYQSDGVVSAIDTTTWTVTESVKIGSIPHHAAIAHDGSRLYLANRGSYSVSVVDTSDLKKEGEIDISAMPRDLVVSTDDKALYVTRASGDAIAIIDTATGSVQQTVDLASGDEFYRPWGLDLTCDGGTLVTSNSGGGGEDNRQVALTDTGTLISELLGMPDENSDGYPDEGARGVAVCPQYVPEGAYLFPQTQTKEAARGEAAEFALTLANFTGAAESFALTLDGNTWNSALSEANVGPLDHGKTAEVSVTVTVPADAEWYATDTVLVKATSVANPSVFEAMAEIVTEAYAPPAISVAPLSLSSSQDAGEVTQKSLQISNGAGVELAFELGSSIGPGTMFSAASTDLYGYAVSGGYVRVVGLSDETDVQLISLKDGSVIEQQSGLNRYETWVTYPGYQTYFKVAADKPVVAYLTDGSSWGYTSFIPSLETGPVGSEFIFHYSQGYLALYVFAIDDVDVELRDADDHVLDSSVLKAGEYWQLNPSSDVYHVLANGRITMEIVAENAYTTVPANVGRAVGRQFMFATDGWGSGAVAVFAYEDADIKLYDLNDNGLLQSATISAGEFWWQAEGLEDRQLRLESSGDVEVWAGNTEGGQEIEDLGDDISFAGGRLGREYYLHSLQDGFVIFAPFDNTELTVDGTSYTLDKDEYALFSDCCAAHHIVANQALIVQTLGGDSYWNDMGSYLGGVVDYSGEPTPWLEVDPSSGTVATEDMTPIDVTFDSRDVQPGTHGADLLIASNDPLQPLVKVPVEMSVEPTADMGRVVGSVSDAWTGEPMKATITLEEVHSMRADPDYEIWATAGTYSLTAAANGYAGQNHEIEIVAGESSTQNVELEPNMARLELTPEALELAALRDSSTNASVTVSNTGPAPMEVSFHEMPAIDSQIMATRFGLEHRSILYDRSHDEPTLSDFATLVGDLTAAGATVEENFVYPIDASALAGFDVLWINCCGYTNWTYNELEAIKVWLDEGGAIMVLGGESPVTSGAADLYGISYNSSCSYGTTTDIAEHPITIDVKKVYVDTCSYATFGSSTVVAVRDDKGQPHAVAHEENRGKMVVVAGSDFYDWTMEQDDNRLLANNIFAWLALPGYEDISWLSTNAGETTIAGHTEQEIMVQIDTSGLVSGVYMANLAVEHNDPNRNTPVTVPVQLTVSSLPSAADFSAAPTSGTPPLAVNFTNLSTGDFNECRWDFGDNETSEVCNDPSHSYNNAGTFTVSLTVNGPGGEDIMGKTNFITVYKPSAADFSASPTTGNSPLEVDFTNLSTGDFNECQWDFGDNGTSKDCDNPSHTYHNAGTYTISLTVKGPGGQDVMAKTNLITVYGPSEADFSAIPNSGIAPLDVDFTNLSGGDFDECLWDFGDNGTSKECDSPSHTYHSAGTFTVSLTLMISGAKDTIVKTGYITVYEPTAADFGAAPEMGVSPLVVNFTNLSTGDFDECRWDFGDGEISEVCENTSHTYKIPGTFTVGLTVNGPGGADTKTVERCVKVSFHSVFLPGVMGNR